MSVEPTPITQSSLDRVIDAARAAGLPVRQRGRLEFQVSCPVHEDRTPSLSVAWKQGPRGGTTVLHCHGCQARPEDIAAALGLAMTDLFDSPPQRQRAPVDLVSRSGRARQSGKRRSRRGPLPKRIADPTARPVLDEPAPAWVSVETYRYVTADGELVQEVARQERVWPDGRREKSFPQTFYVDGSASDRKPAGFVPVLYRYPEVVAAIAAGQPVWLCEGEKDVHAAERLGLVATTNAQGSNGFPAELAGVFAGADVRVVLDRDAAGFRRALRVQELLETVADRVQMLLPAPTAPKSDLADHVEAGFGVDELVSVSVDDVATWSATGECQAGRDAVAQALRETLAQQRAAEAAGTKKAATQHASNAQRWALEAEIRLERMAPKVEVAQHLARTADTRWAARAAVLAVELYGEAVGDAREAFETVGLALPPALATSPPVAAPTPGAAPDRVEVGRPGPVHARTSVFRIENGAVCEVVAGKDGGEDHLKTLLELDVRVKTYHVRERPEQIPVTGPDGADEVLSTQADARRTLVAVTLTCTDPTSGQTLEWRVTADEWNAGTWLNDLPGRPPFDRRRTGRDRLTQAVNYVSGGAAETAVYRVTGWREDGFVTAGGLIHADGLHATDVAMTGALHRYRLPEPTRDAAELRAAFTGASGTHWLSVLPARVAAPLLGQVYRSAARADPDLAGAVRVGIDEEDVGGVVDDAPLGHRVGTQRRHRHGQDRRHRQRPPHPDEPLQGRAVLARRRQPRPRGGAGPGESRQRHAAGLQPAGAVPVGPGRGRGVRTHPGAGQCADHLGVPPDPGVGAGTGGAGADGARGDRPGDPAGTRRQRVAAGEGPVDVVDAVVAGAAAGGGHGAGAGRGEPLLPGALPGRLA